MPHSPTARQGSAHWDDAPILADDGSFDLFYLDQVDSDDGVAGLDETTTGSVDEL